MNTRLVPQVGQSPRHHLKHVWVPSRNVEYAYYFAISYSTIAAYLNVEIPLVAAGLITYLAGFCFVKSGSSRRDIYAPVALLLACQISYILVQVAVHSVSVMSEDLRWFILWFFTTLIVPSLCLRHGFLFRCTIVIFALGLIAVPHLGFNMENVERARADINIGGGLQNPNGLAVWFGFCAVSFGIAGIETKRGNVRRVLYWIAAIVSLTVMALSVSRSALFGCAIALAFGFRHILKRGFFPVLLLIVFAGVVLESGWINQIVSNFEVRATEETGRFLMWPHVIQRILASPFVGVGVLDKSTFIPEMGQSISTPHNSFLFFALTSGIVPFAFFLAFWVRAAWGSLFDERRSEYSPFRTPLFLYALVAFFASDVSAEPWTVLALAVAAGPLLSLRSVRSAITNRTRHRGLPARVQFSPKAKTIQ